LLFQIEMRVPIVERLWNGLAGGITATIAMTGVMAIAKKVGALGEMPPRKLMRRVARVFGGAPRGASLEVATALAHLGFGAAVGEAYSLVQSQPRRPVATVLLGSAYGFGVWALNYRGWIPRVGLMRHAKHDRPGRPTSMIVAHLVYGVTLAGIVNALAARRGSWAPASPASLPA